MVPRTVLFSAVWLAAACGGGAGGQEVVAGANVAFIAVDDVNLAWTEVPAVDGSNGVIRLLSKQNLGGTPLEVGSGRELLAAGGLLYWNDDLGSVSSRDPGGAVATLFARPSPDEYILERGLARDSAHLYEALAVGTQAAPGWEIWSIPLDGAPPLLLASEAGDALPFGLASDETNLYFTLAPGGSASAPGEIRRVPVAGGDVETLMTDPSRPEQVALGPNGVYWTSAAAALDDPGMPTGRIFVAPKAGGTTVALADLWGDGELAIDGASLYWAGPAEGSRVALARIPVDGGNATTVAVLPGTTAAAMAVDATYVYWSFWDAAGGAGGILRTPKP